MNHTLVQATQQRASLKVREKVTHPLLPHSRNVFCGWRLDLSLFVIYEGKLWCIIYMAYMVMISARCRAT